MLRDQILALAAPASARAREFRRDFHKYPELAYTEFRTGSLVARRLTELGFAVRLGRDVMKAESRLGVPSAEVLEQCYQRAAAEGADPDFLPLLRGGFPGVVGEISGAEPGPTVALRIDMDALPIHEAESADHLPAREGFRSVHPGLMHACAHDGHTAIGLGIAEVLAGMKDRLKGTYRLIFQPGEEGGKGAVPMVDAGVVDGVDYFLACHLGMEAPSGHLYPVVAGFLASTKLDATFKGQSAHAGGRPEKGRNAMLGAAQAVMGLYAIARHSDGTSRVNVGVLQAGSGRNVIPDRAFLMLEVRGETDTVESYMVERAKAILNGAALAHDLDVEITFAGRTTTAVCDPAMASLVSDAAQQIPAVKVVQEPWPAGGSEDATFMMRRVQEQGGIASYVGLGSDIPSGHHTPLFDFQEADLEGGIGALALTMAELGSRSR